MKKFLQFFGVVVFAALPMLANAHGPTRQMVEESVQIDASPEKVWEVVKDFSALEKWHPAIASTEMLDDKTRLLTLKGDGNVTITEELDKINDEKMTLIYKIEDMSVVKTITFNSQDTPYYTLPVSNYKAWIFVKPKGDGTEVTWRAKFYRSFMANPPVPEGQSDDDAVKAIKGVVTAGLDNLKVIMEK